MVGLVAGSDEGLPGLKDYKDTRSKKNPTSRKVRDAARVVEAVESGDLDLWSVACLGRERSWYEAGEAMLRSLPATAATVAGDEVVIEGQKVPIPFARAMTSYAIGLSCIGHLAAQRCQKLGITEIKVLLDRLPNSDVSNPTELLRRISHHPDLFTVSKQIETDYGVTFEFADEWTFHKPGSSPIAGKQHPNAILTG